MMYRPIVKINGKHSGMYKYFLKLNRNCVQLPNPCKIGILNSGLDSSIAVPLIQFQTNVYSCLSHLIAYMYIFWQVNMTWHNIPWLSDYIPRSLCRRNTMKIFSPVISCPTMLYHPQCILTIQNATIIVHCLNSGQAVK